MNADIVVAGAGHNSLVTAAYLAASGRTVVVLESRAVPGGGAATEELLGPGYLIDTCSTGHTLIQTNPLLLHDELGLKERYGLEYIVPDPLADLIRDHGGTVLCGKRVVRLIVEGGRCAGVQTEDGDVFRAREAVVSTI